MARRGFVALGLLIICIIVMLFFKKSSKEGFVAPITTVSTFAGSSPGFANGQGTAAKFAFPQGITIDRSGNLYVSDSGNHKIRKIVIETKQVETIAGSISGFANGQGTTAMFSSPLGITVDSSGNLYVADSGNHKIRKIDTSGNVETIAGSSSGFANGQDTAAKFFYPSGIIIDPSGQFLYVADKQNNKIRKIVIATKQVTTIADTTVFNLPRGITIDSSGNLYVADSGSHRIRKIDTSGNVETIAGSSSGFADGNGLTTAKFSVPQEITIDSSGQNLYVADYGNNRIRKIVIATKQVDTVATINLPAGITIDSSGTLYVIDTGSHRISKIGLTCATGYQPSNGDCVSCPAGTYGTDGSTCTPCAAGTTSVAGATSATACTPCAAGKFSAAGASCTDCPQNATCPTKTDFTCNPGYEKSVSGLTCQQLTCAPGKYVNGSICTDCEAGTTSVAGATSASACTACQPGTYSAAGASSCTTCPANATCTSTDFTCNPGYTKSGSTCQQVTCAPGKYVNGSTCTDCEAGSYSSGGTVTSCTTCGSGFTSPAGSTSQAACTCQRYVTVNGVTKCFCPTLSKPPMTQGSDNAIMLALVNCEEKTFNYKNNGVTQTTNPCTNSFYDFDKEVCVNKLGSNVGLGSSTPCSSSTVYSNQTNACVPVRVIVKSNNPQLIDTTGNPGQGDFTGCRTVDQGDCTIVFRDSLGNPITANPCRASNQLYNFATKTCVPKTKPCCNYTDPLKAVADKSCAADTSLVITKNTALCPTNSRTLCCNNAYATNTTCIKSNFWTPSYQFNTSHTTKCASGFQDYQGLHLLNKKKDKMNRIV